MATKQIKDKVLQTLRDPKYHGEISGNDQTWVKLIGVDYPEILDAFVELKLEEKIEYYRSGDGLIDIVRLKN